jgi:serpin B
LAGASESFGALARTVDFADPAVKDEINGWVRGITNGLIPELLKARLDPSTLAALVNSLYLKAAWVNQFDKEATHDGSYWISESESIQHPLMHDTVFNRGYYEDKEWQAAAFPLAKGRFKFTVLLPRARRSAKSISAGLSVGLLNKALMAERSQKLEVTLPTMKVRSRPDVEAYLRARAPGAFGPKADFSALAQEPVRISSVVHETVVSVDEKGVEAAAATAIIMVASAAPFGKADEPVLFTVDRPFVYVITHAETGAPLFLGVVGDPRES